MAVDGERDLFGKIYTYEEILALADKKPEWATGPTPAHWPQDGTEIDPAKWVFWLPDGWGQGLKPTGGGKTLKCFITPPEIVPMKRYFHKDKVIDFCAKMGLPGPKEEVKVEAKVRGVHDSIPTWPEWDLPRDWRLVFKQLPTGLHKCFIPPGQDEGFLYQRECVQKYLTEGKNLTMFADSKPMAQRSAEALIKDPNKKIKKRKLAVANLDDFVDCSFLVVVQIAVQISQKEAVKQLKKSKISNPDELVSTALKLHSVLVSRGFPSTTDIIAVCRTGESGSEDMDKYVKHICGHYYKKIERDRPIYQKIQLASAGSTGVVCNELHISWSDGFGGIWKIGRLGDETAGLAIHKDDQPNPQSCKSGWRVYSKAL